MRHVLASSIVARTTLDIDSSVLAQLRRRARAERKSMGQLASERLAVSLGAQTPSDTRPLTWPNLHMGAPRVDLYDRDALWRVLDAGDASNGDESQAS
jgi:hypothetical protein